MVKIGFFAVWLSSFGSVPFFMGNARGIVVRAHDDMAHSMAAADPTQLHRAPFIGGPACFGPRHVTAEARTEASAHAVTTGEQVEGVAFGLQSHILDGKRRGAATRRARGEEDHGHGPEPHIGVSFRGRPLDSEIA